MDGGPRERTNVYNTPTGTGNKTPTLVLVLSLILASGMIMLVSFLSFLVITDNRAPIYYGEPNGKSSSTSTREIREYRDTRDSNNRVRRSDKEPAVVSEN